MATPQKPKTRRKAVAKINKGRRPWSAKTLHDEMVVFPTASGKLATTWMKNVDNIISEGTGNISVERLKVMQGKLKTALDLVTNRITEEEVKLSENISAKNKYDKLNDFCKNWVGKVVCLRMRNTTPCPLLPMLVCKVSMDADQTLHIDGLRFRHNNDGVASTLSTYAVNLSIERITVQDRICFYTIDPGEPYELVIDVGRTPPVNAKTIIDFVENTAKMVAMGKEIKPEAKHPEEKKCQHKVKLRRKSAKPEP